MKKSRRFVIADIHGGYKALRQCLQQCEFDYDLDELISTGDIVDGYDEVYECVEELMKIRNLITVRGNHDDLFTTFLQFDFHPTQWTGGGLATLVSYGRNLLGDKFKADFNFELDDYNTNLTAFHVPQTHKDFFKNQLDYYIDEDNNLFVHAGFNRHFPIKDQMSWIFQWDRDLWNSAMNYSSMDSGNGTFKIKDKFNNIFIGHTSTTRWAAKEEKSGGIITKLSDERITTPMRAFNIINLDTGAGGSRGKLTIMNIDTKEYFQSDLMSDLYPSQQGKHSY